MSTTRIAVRVLLVVIILGMGWIGYRAWARKRPDYYWDKAQSALSAGDRAAARIYLQNLLARNPRDDRAHEEMAKLILAEAKEAGRPDSYAANPQALFHLGEAAKLRPADLELQKQLLALYLATRRLQDAAVVADRVAKVEPNYSDAVYARAWRAVDTKDARETEKLLEQLTNLQSRHVFQTAALTVRHFDAAGNRTRVQNAFSTACELAGKLDAEQFALLSANDREMMLQLLPEAVAQAPDVNTAHVRAAATLSACETLLKAKQRPPGDLADAAGRLMILLSFKHALTPDASDQKTTRVRLADRATQLWSVAIEAGDATPLVYHQAATAAFTRGEFQAALDILKKGFAATASLPESRAKELVELHALAARQFVVLGRYAEAEEHINVLLGDSDAAGWGHLLAGSVALSEGRLEKALDHYLRARQLLGDTLLVRMALANTYLALNQWATALPYLASLHINFDDLDPEQKAWAKQHLRSGENIHFGELRARLSLGQWDKAQPHLEALKRSQFEPRAWALAVEYLWNNKNAAQASALLADVRRRFPRDEMLLSMEVAVLEQTGKSDELQQLLERFVAEAPDQLAGQILLCRWRLSDGQSAQALAQLEALPANIVKTPRDRLVVAALKAQALLAMDKPEEALALAEELRANPSTAAAAGVIGATAALKRDDLSGAAEAMDAAGQADSRSGMIGMLRGQLAVKQGDFASAVTDFAKSLDVTALRDQARAQLLGSLVLMARQKSPAEADAKVDELLKRYPDDPMLLIAKADLHFQQDRFDSGMAVLDRVEKLEPKSPTSAYLKATAWLRKKETDRALAELERALRIDPNHLPALASAAQACVQAKQYTKALDYTQTALRLQPDLWKFTLIRVEALKQLERRDEAMTALENLTKSQPELAVGYSALAAEHIAAGQPDKAVEVFRAGRRHVPKDLSLVLSEIGVLAKSDRMDEAQTLAEEATNVEPDWQKTWSVSQTFAAVQQFDAAREWGRKALELADAEQKPSVHLLLGNVALSQGSVRSDPELLAEARDHFAAVVAKQPTHFMAGNNLAWLLATEFNQPDEAVRVAEKVRGETPIEKLPVVVATMARRSTVVGSIGQFARLVRGIEVD